MPKPKDAYLRLNPDIRRDFEEKVITLYADYPYEEVTARVICDVLDINPATLYRWFASKDALYIHLMQTMLTKVRPSADTPWSMDNFLVSKTSADQILSELELRFVQSWVRAPRDVIWDLIQDTFLSDTNVLQNNLLRMQQAGEVRADIDIELTTFIYYTMLNNVHLYITSRGITDHKEIIRIYRSVFFNLLQYGIKGYPGPKV